MKMSRLQKKYINRPKNAARKIEFLDGLISGIDMSGVSEALEVGCGPGYLASHVRREYGIRVVGTDMDPEEVEFARRVAAGSDGLTLIQADSTSLPFDDDRFDLVFSQMVLHHIPEWETALSEITRVTRPGGYYLFHDLTYSRLLTVLFKPVLRTHSFYSIDAIVDCLNGLGMAPVFQLERGTYYLRQFTEYNIAFRKRARP